MNKPKIKNPPVAAGVKKPAVGERYYEATGGRKTAHALVRFFPKKGDLIVNGKRYSEYFKNPKNQLVARASFEAVSLLDMASAIVKVSGGGLNAQAEAIRNGLAKALAMFNPEFKSKLRSFGYITRDDRMVERKKYGLKKARRAPQWAKR